MTCIDVYKEWSKDVLQLVAYEWLRQKAENKFLNKQWENCERNDEHCLKEISFVMAEIHFAAREFTKATFGDKGIEVYSPLKFIEFIDLYRNICNLVTHEKMVCLVVSACICGLSIVGFECI